MDDKPTQQHIQRVIDSAMGIIAEHGVDVHMKTVNDVRTTPFKRATTAGLVFVYTPVEQLPGHYLQIRRAENAEPLASLSWDDSGGVASWLLLPGGWQQAMFAKTRDQWRPVAGSCRLSDIEPRFTCQACGTKGANVRPNLHWRPGSSSVFQYL